MITKRKPKFRIISDDKKAECSKHGKYTILEDRKNCLKCHEPTQKFIEKAKAIHGDKYDYSKSYYINAKEKVIIICPDHDEFLQTPTNHFRSYGCQKCSSKQNAASRTKPQSKFIEECIKIHGDKYDYSKMNYINCKQKVIIICPEHREFNQIPSNHLLGKGCPACGGTKKYTQEEWIEKAQKIHSNKYKYGEVKYVNRCTNVIITCPDHGNFDQTPGNHLSGKGCFSCGIKEMTKLQSKFIEECIKIHGNKYDYSKLNYIKSTIKVVINCLIHGDFEQTPNCHLSGRGCPRCGGTGKYTQEEWIEKAQKIHSNKYKYEEVKYVNSRKKVEIICSVGHLFSQKPSMHLQGRGCPKCLLCPSCSLWRTGGVLCEYCKPASKLYRKTKEMAVVKFLKEKLPEQEFIHNKSVGSECTGNHLFPDIRFDLPKFQLIIEVDEHQHRGSSYSCEEKRMCDIVAKLGLPCIFIRYNPDNKNADKEELLKKINEYIQVEDDKTYENLGIDKIKSYKAEYMYYK